MRRVLHITNFSERGGGTEAAKVLSSSQDLFLYLERSRGVCSKDSQVYYLSIIKIIFWAVSRRNDFEVIHSHGRFPGLITRIFLKPFLPKKILVHSFHGIGSFELGLKQRVLIILETVLSIFTRLVIFNSDVEKTSANLRLFCQDIILGNGVSCLKISNKQKLADSSVFLLGFAATFSFPKEHEKLIELIAKFNEQSKVQTVHLIFCGDGPNRKHIDNMGRKLLGERFESLGQLKDVSIFFEKLDGYIHFSKFESFGLATVEAFANKIPVILNEGLPFSDLSNICFSFPPDDIEKQLVVLNNFITNETKREVNKNNAYKMYAEKFDENAVRRKYRSLICAL